MGATHSNDFSITHFNSCQHCKIALEQKRVEMLFVLYPRYQEVPALVYISAVGEVTIMRRARTVYSESKYLDPIRPT